MSTFIAGFDGCTCCNCGRASAVHAADGSCLTPARERTLLDCLDAAGLARGLLSIVEHGSWACAPDPSGDVRCRACGCLAGYDHHPACGYGCFAERIKAL